MNFKHGKTLWPEYRAWRNMIARCGYEHHRAYGRYGGRGISVCHEWTESFDTFCRDMGRRPTKLHSLDRIDNDGDYEPGNCRWATIEQQARNMRSNLCVCVDGQSMTLAEACRITGVGYQTAYARWRAGKSDEEVLDPQRAAAHGG